MATRNALTSYLEETKVLAVWSGLLNGDVGDAQGLSKWAIKAVQVIGTFGAGGSVALEGSNDGGTTWAALRDSTGTTIALTAATAIRDVLENPRMIRPHVTAGDGTTSLTFYLWGS
jgi:hypothetical protein